LEGPFQSPRGLEAILRDQIERQAILRLKGSCNSLAKGPSPEIQAVGPRLEVLVEGRYPQAGVRPAQLRTMSCRVLDWLPLGCSSIELSWKLALLASAQNS